MQTLESIAKKNILKKEKIKNTTHEQTKHINKKDKQTTQMVLYDKY